MFTAAWPSSSSPRLAGVRLHTSAVRRTFQSPGSRRSSAARSRGRWSRPARSNRSPRSKSSRRPTASSSCCRSRSIRRSRPAPCSVELDRENLMARVREARATLQGARAAHSGGRGATRKEPCRGRRPGGRVCAALARAREEPVRTKADRADTSSKKRARSSTRPRTAGARLSRSCRSRRRACRRHQRTSRRRRRPSSAQRKSWRTPPSARRFADGSSRATSRSAAPCRRFSIWAPPRRRSSRWATSRTCSCAGVSTRPKSAICGSASRRGSGSRRSRSATFQGKVTQISPMGVERDNVTNFEVRVSIDNPGNELKANMTANAEIVLEERPNVLIVPEAAITYDATRKPSVDVLDPSRAHRPPARADQSRHQQRHAHAGARGIETRGSGGPTELGPAKGGP